MTREQFYPLTESELVGISNLKGAYLKVYLWLSVQMPFPDSQPIEIDTAHIAGILGIARRTVQLALSRLSEMKLFEWEPTKVKVWRSQRQKPKSQPKSQPKPEPKPEPEFEANHNSRSIDRQRDPEITETIYRSPERSIDREREPEPAPQKDSKPLQTIQTNPDYTNRERGEGLKKSGVSEEAIEEYERHLESLPADEADRFKRFIISRAKSLPKPPAIQIKWAASNWKYLWQEFQQSQQTPTVATPSGFSVEEVRSRSPEIEQPQALSNIRAILNNLRGGGSHVATT